MPPSTWPGPRARQARVRRTGRGGARDGSPAADRDSVSTLINITKAERLPAAQVASPASDEQETSKPPAEGARFRFPEPRQVPGAEAIHTHRISTVSSTRRIREASRTRQHRPACPSTALRSRPASPPAEGGALPASQPSVWYKVEQVHRLPLTACLALSLGACQASGWTHTSQKISKCTALSPTARPVPVTVKRAGRQ